MVLDGRARGWGSSGVHCGWGGFCGDGQGECLEGVVSQWTGAAAFGASWLLSGGGGDCLQGLMVC
jgi:hypothetical protein